LGQAIKNIVGFSSLNEEFRRKMLINGYSMNTYTNYVRGVAFMCLQFGVLPEEISNVEIEKFLLDIKMNRNPSESYYKQTIAGLSTLFRLTGKLPRKIVFPRIPRKETLPLVLSKKECRKFFESIQCLKHRVLIVIAYSGGLRSSEVCSLKWSDVDFSGKRILIKAGKNRRDRYMILSPILTKLLKQYRNLYKPEVYLFCGNRPGSHLARGTLQGIFKNNFINSGIIKTVQEPL